MYADSYGNVKSCRSVTDFKSRLKTHLYKLAFESVFDCDTRLSFLMYRLLSMLLLTTYSANQSTSTQKKKQ